MRKALQYTELIIIGSVLLALSGCTWNPFGEEEISSGYRKVSGNVQLNDGSNPDGIYVWLEGFNVGSYTDGTGQFSLTLPQSGSGDLSGVYKLYFYVANYELDFAQVVIQDGGFVYSRGDINKEGKLALPKVLRRFLRIETSVNPASVSQNYTENIGVAVTLTATTDSATVTIPRSIGGSLGAVLIRKIGSQEVFIHEFSPYSGMDYNVLVGRQQPQVIGMTFNMLLKPLLRGDYEVIPYLLMAHESIPGDLFETMGPNVRELSLDYLKIPFLRIGGEFKVQ